MADATRNNTSWSWPQADTEELEIVIRELTRELRIHRRLYQEMQRPPKPEAVPTTDDVNGLREQLAAQAHESWCGWMRHMFGKTQGYGKGQLIPAHLVDRWHRQMGMDYADLPRTEQLSDLKEADEYLAIFSQFVTEDPFDDS